MAINSGVLQIGNAGALNSTTPNAVSFGASSTGVLRLNGIGVTVSGLDTNATVGTPIVEDNNATGATLTVQKAASTSSTFGGVLQNGTAGVLTLVKTGLGTLDPLRCEHLHRQHDGVSAGTLNITGSLTAATCIPRPGRNCSTGT